MKDELHHFIKLMRLLQKIDNEFPIQYAVCLSIIALEEGLSLTDLANQTNMPISTVSRMISALSKNKNGGVSYGLVKVTVSKKERRKKKLSLTVKGRKIVNDVSKMIGILAKNPQKTTKRGLKPKDQIKRSKKR